MGSSTILYFLFPKQVAWHACREGRVDVVLYPFSFVGKELQQLNQEEEEEVAL